MKDKFEFVKQQENAYTQPITIVQGWEWNMKKHIRLTTLYKNSQFADGNTDTDREDKPFKNIVAPILDLQYRTEGFDVKDVILYIDNEDHYFKSLLVKKYHDRWAVENGIDTFIDEVNESRIDYGLALIKDLNRKCPEVVPLSSIAFCDQTNILSGPMGFKHFYSPDELQDFAALGWGDPKNGADHTIEELIILAKEEKVTDSQTGQATPTPGKYFEAYEVHGMLPETWLPGRKETGSEDKYIRQVQILAYYTDKDGKKQGITLFAGRERPGLFKAIKRKIISGRACGLGGVEELFDHQIWTNYGEIVIKQMLDAASKIIIKTTDASLAQKHPKGLKEMDNLTFLHHEEGTDSAQLNTQPVNVPFFNALVDRWHISAKEMSSANDSLLGLNPPAGTPFKLENLVTQQGLGTHDYRKGQFATWMETVYREYIMEDILKDMLTGKKWLEDLSLKELQYVADALVTCQTNDIIVEKILAGKEIVPSDIEKVKAGIRSQFMKRGTKHFFEILDQEMKGTPLAVKIDIAGKQKDLDKITDKVVNIIRQVVAAPQILQIPGMAELFNQIIEYSGLNPVDFSSLVNPKPITPAPQKQQFQPQTPIDTPLVPTPPVAA